PCVVGVQNVGAGVLAPKIRVFDEGTKVTLRATQSDDLNSAQLDGRIELTQVEAIPTTSIQFNSQPVTIQTPRVKRCRIDVSSSLADGQSLLIGCFPSHEQKRFLYVLLTVLHIAPETATN